MTLSRVRSSTSARDTTSARETPRLATSSRGPIRSWHLGTAAAVAALALVAGPISPATAGDAPDWWNTGIPDGTRTTQHHGDLVITDDGTVIDGLEVFGFIRVEAAHVTIRNTIVRGRPTDSADALISARSERVSKLRIEDVTLAAAHPSPYINGVYGHHFTMRRTEITGVIDSVHIFGDEVNVYNSWMHDNLHYESDPTWHGRPSHDDTIQIQEGSHINISSNTMSDSNNAALMITQDSGKVGHVKFTWNRVSGGSCSLNVAEKNRGTIRGLKIRSNTFGPSSGNCNMIIDRSTESAASISGNSRRDGRRITLLVR